MAYRDTFEPLRIMAYLRTGIVADRWFPLDSVIWYQAHRLALGPEVMTTPGGNSQKHKVSIPLKIIHRPENWYFACSWAYPQPWWIVEGRDHWNKRFRSNLSHLVDFENRRGKVVIEQGRYKAYHMPIFYKAALRIEWYCVGDKREIESLLSTVTHIGKKTAQGWGRVIRWAVEPWPEDYSVWREGRLMRGIPPEDAAGQGVFPLANYGIRPSYYRRENQMTLAVPG